MPWNFFNQKKQPKKAGAEQGLNRFGSKGITPENFN